MPAHHDVGAADVASKPRMRPRGGGRGGPQDFEHLFNARHRREDGAALALVAEMIHGAPYRFRDPARHSFAHGGKDGHPFPVPIRVYDQTITVLKRRWLRRNWAATKNSPR